MTDDINTRLAEIERRLDTIENELGIDTELETLNHAIETVNDLEGEDGVSIGTVLEHLVKSSVAENYGHAGDLIHEMLYQGHIYEPEYGVVRTT